MEVTEQRLLTIGESSQAGEARRLAQWMAERAGFDATDAGTVAIVVSEVATNLVKHAREARLLLYTEKGDPARVCLLALDRGPGIADLTSALRDGMSSAGSSGTGLGAIGRLAAEFDVYSTPGGTALFAAVSQRSAVRTDFPLRIGAISVAMAGESECGDGFAVVRAPSRTALLVVDGLGHGSGAATAAAAAIQAFRAHAAEGPKEQISRLHAALRGTRGAAASIAELDHERRVMRFAGVGNVAGTIVSPEGTRSAVSHHGILGHEARRIDEFTYPWPPGATVVLHSDGLQSRWSVESYPGLLRRHPMLGAGVLFRDFNRGRDDVTVLVAGETT
jgi:anti-sigma regulatory factor (Ser/Thr protein kinase)